MDQPRPEKGGRIDAVQCDTTFVEFYPDDELSMLLGRVVRAGALTEMQVRNVYSTLVAGSLAVALKLGQIDHVTRAVEEMIPACTQLTAERKSLVLRVMKATRTVMEGRHRYVHDIWYPVDDDNGAPTWQRMEWTHLARFERTRTANVSKDEVQAVLTKFSQVNAQLRHLVWALMSVLPHFEGSTNALPDVAWDELTSLVAAST